MTDQAAPGGPGVNGSNGSNGADGSDRSDRADRPPRNPVAPPGADSDAAAPADRPTPLRLARIHLRLGALALARAELESLAGRDALDEEALLDLAEARWRTGDLAGAGEAANALVERGRNDALALVIAAESVAALGRPSEAGRLAALAVEAADVPLDVLFAGMPRSAVWPGEPEGAPVAAGSQGPADAAPAAAAEAYAGGRAALGADDSPRAALGLGVALRLEPEYAQAVLDAIGEQPDDPALALVVGDALRLLGRETDARAAFDRARGAASSRRREMTATAPAARPGAGQVARDAGATDDTDGGEDDDEGV